MREGGDLCGVHIIRDVPGFAFFGEHRPAAEHIRRHHCQRDARRFDREHLVDTLPREKALVLLRHVIEKRRVKLMVEKAVDPEDPAGLYYTVGKYALFKLLHDGEPPNYLSQGKSRKKPVGFDRLCFG